MGEVQWIKLYIDMFDKRKIKKLRRLPAGNELLLIWIMLLATAGKCNAGGHIFITETVPFTEEDLADELGFEVSTIKLALKAFEELDMISSNDGFIAINNWEEYQNTDKLAEIREQNRERKRLQRERKKQELLDVSRDSHVTVTEDVTGCHAIEEDKEEEKDLEEENHSFIRSASEEEEYIRKKVEESGLDGEDAEAYKDELKENLKLKFMRGDLGQGVVLMSVEQFDDLMDNLSFEEVNKYFGIVVECEKNGQHFKKKTHYQAILDMVKKDRRLNKC